MFSLLEPGAKIKPHYGPLRGIVRLHVGLDTPNDPECYILVDGKRYHWKDGEIVIFDDTYEHQVHNNTDKARMVLFCDVQRPLADGIPSSINDFVIEYLAPLTSRANDKNERTTK